MRVTSNQFTDSLVLRLNSLSAQQYSLQNQISSGLRVQAPSDDPAAMQSVLASETSKAAQEQYQSNISTLQTRADLTYTTLQSLQTISNRLGEIATLAGDPTKSSSTSQSDLDKYAAEVADLTKQALQLANTKDPATGQYLFGGTASGQPPYVAATDANGNITGVTYQGNTSANAVEIADGATVSVDVPGENNSGAGAHGLITDSRSGADLFSHMISLRNNLSAGDRTAINSTDTVALGKDEDNILYQVSNNGAVQSRLTAAASYASSSVDGLNKSISNASDADAVQTLVQLTQAQNSYQAALSSGAKLMQLSLLNYLQ